MGTCERCGGQDTWVDEQGRTRVADFTDFCAVCSKNLCKKCMAKGCCGHTPAQSGEGADDETLAEGGDE